MPATEISLSTTGQNVYLVQASGTCTVSAQTHECSPMECLTAGPYVTLDVTLEKLEHPALRRGEVPSLPERSGLLTDYSTIRTGIEAKKQGKSVNN